MPHTPPSFVPAFWVAAISGAMALAAESAPLRFDRDIRPLLSENCYACHGPGQQEAGLRLDSAEEATRELDSGARAIVAGDLTASELIARINATDPDVIMPPPQSKKALSPEQKELLTRWIQAGAPYEKHWSYRPIERPEVPAGPAAEPAQPAAAAKPEPEIVLHDGPPIAFPGSKPRPPWGSGRLAGPVRPAAPAATPLDRFLDAAIAAAKLPANAEADRPTLIRRLSFALTGLPPSPEQV
ncbi:MAG: c-type cytochrome domain-containing protein, partial [Planctomycetia bacterium]